MTKIISLMTLAFFMSTQVAWGMRGEQPKQAAKAIGNSLSTAMGAGASNAIGSPDEVIERLRSGDREFAVMAFASLARDVLNVNDVGEGDDIEKLAAFLEPLRMELVKIEQALDGLGGVNDGGVYIEDNDAIKYLRSLADQDSGSVSLPQLAGGRKMLMMARLWTAYKTTTEKEMNDAFDAPLDTAVQLPARNILKRLSEGPFSTIINSVNAIKESVKDADSHIKMKDIEDIYAAREEIKNMLAGIGELSRACAVLRDGNVSESFEFDKTTKIALLSLVMDFLLSGNLEENIVSYLPENMNTNSLVTAALSMFSASTKEEAEEIFNKAIISIFGIGKALLYKVERADGGWQAETYLVASSGIHRTSRHVDSRPVTDEKLWALQRFEEMKAKGEPLFLRIEKRSLHFLGPDGRVDKEHYVDRKQFQDDAAEFGNTDRVEEKVYVGITDPITGEIAYILALDNWQLAAEGDDTRAKPLFDSSGDFENKQKYISIFTHLLALLLNRISLDMEIEGVLNMRSGTEAMSQAVHSVKNASSWLLLTKVPGVEGDFAQEFERSKDDLYEECHNFMREITVWQEMVKKKGEFSTHARMQDIDGLSSEELEALSSFIEQAMLILNNEDYSELDRLAQECKGRFEQKELVGDLIDWLLSVVKDEVEIRKDIRVHMDSLKERFDILQAKIADLQEKTDIAFSTFGDEIQKDEAFMANYNDFLEKLKAFRDVVRSGNIVQDLDMENIDLADFLRRIITRYNLKTVDNPDGSSPALYTIYIDDNLPPVSADSNKLGVAVAELIMNTRKYGGEKVELKVRAETAEGQTWVRVDIKDSGIGMGREDAEGIFVATVRTEEAQKLAPGSGLGLGDARDFIRRMGGDLFVSSSKPGEGSTFTMRLRAADRVAAGAVGLLKMPTRQELGIPEPPRDMPGRPRGDSYSGSYWEGHFYGLKYGEDPKRIWLARQERDSVRKKEIRGFAEQIASPEILAARLDVLQGYMDGTCEYSRKTGQRGSRELGAILGHVRENLAVYSNAQQAELKERLSQLRSYIPSMERPLLTACLMGKTIAAAIGVKERAESAIAMLADFDTSDEVVKAAMRFFDGTQRPDVRAHLKLWYFNMRNRDLARSALSSLGIKIGKYTRENGFLLNVNPRAYRTNQEVKRRLNSIIDEADVRKKLKVSILAAIVVGNADHALEDELTARMGLDKVVFSKDAAGESIAAAETQIKEYAGENKYFVIIVDTQKNEVRSAMLDAPAVSWQVSRIMGAAPSGAISFNDAIREYFSSV